MADGSVGAGRTASAASRASAQRSHSAPAPLPKRRQSFSMNLPRKDLHMYVTSAVPAIYSRMGGSKGGKRTCPGSPRMLAPPNKLALGDLHRHDYCGETEGTSARRCGKRLNPSNTNLAQREEEWRPGGAGRHWSPTGGKVHGGRWQLAGHGAEAELQWPGDPDPAPRIQSHHTPITIMPRAPPPVLAAARKGRAQPTSAYSGAGKPLTDVVLASKLGMPDAPPPHALAPFGTDLCERPPVGLGTSAPPGLALPGHSNSSVMRTTPPAQPLQVVTSGGAVFRQSLSPPREFYAPPQSPTVPVAEGAPAATRAVRKRAGGTTNRTTAELHADGALGRRDAGDWGMLRPGKHASPARAALRPPGAGDIIGHQQPGYPASPADTHGTLQQEFGSRGRVRVGVPGSPARDWTPPGGRQCQPQHNPHPARRFNNSLLSHSATAPVVAESPRRGPGYVAGGSHSHNGNIIAHNAQPPPPSPARGPSGQHRDGAVCGRPIPVVLPLPANRYRGPTRDHPMPSPLPSDIFNRDQYADPPGKCGKGLSAACAWSPQRGAHRQADAATCTIQPRAFDPRDGRARGRQRSYTPQPVLAPPWGVC